jgi:alpha 1,2-mannosyltransferase
MFLPRVQSKLIAVVLVIGTLYLITDQWGTPKVPTSFTNPFAGQHSKYPSPAAAPTGKALAPPVKPPTEDKDASKPQARPKVSVAAEPLNAPSEKAQSTKESSKSKPPTPVASEPPLEYTPLPKEPGLPHLDTKPGKFKPAASGLNITWSATTKEGQIAFWKDFAPLLESGAPDCPPPSRLGTAEAQPFSYKPTERYDVLSMPDGDVTKMQKAHEKFVEGLHGKAAKLVYIPGSRGLVTTAGGAYLPVFAVSLRMLRRKGTTLPMEVFLADEKEYESHMCENVFPELNAKCVILSEIMEAVPHAIKISHYQYKLFAMIFSSFDEALFLDSDAFTVLDANYLFTKEPFISNGLVTWPDYWASSASPLYYKIAGQPVPPLLLRQSTESGELLINKKTHAKSLLLATYYNYYGSHYYTLFSQGAAGEGDKETFIAASSALNETFYQVVEPVRAIGHSTSTSWTGSAMVQYDPVQDYGLTQKNLYRNKDKDAAGPIRPFFLHVNVPRLNPFKVFDHPEHTKDVKDQPQRIWQGVDAIIAMFNGDIEKEIWDEVRWVSCTLENKFEGFKDAKGICDKATKHYESVFGKIEQEPKKIEQPLSESAAPSSKPGQDAPHSFRISSGKSGRGIG